MRITKRNCLQFVSMTFMAFMVIFLGANMFHQLGRKTPEPIPDLAAFTLRGHNDFVTGVALSPDGSWIASSSGDQNGGEVRIWDAKTHKVLRTIKAHRVFTNCIAISPDGKTIASGGRKGTIYVHDAKTGKLLYSTFVAQSRRTTSVAIGPKGRYLVAAATNAYLFDVSNIKAVGYSKQISVQTAIFTPDGNNFVFNVGKAIRVVNIEQSKMVQTFEGHQAPITSLAITGDGRRIVSGSDDKTVKVWDATKGKELLTLKGHTGRITSVAVSPDGKRIVSAGHDRCIRVWDGSTGKEIRTLTGHTLWVTSVAISANGQRIVSGSADNTVKIWDLDKLS